MVQTKENKMGTMPVNRLILTMSLPIAISMIVQALYNIVDSVFVSQISEQALTGVTVAFPMQNLMIAVATGTGVGISALLSKSLGEGKRERASRTANNGLLLAFLSYLVFLLVGLFLAQPFVASQEKDAAVVEYGTIYLSTCSIFSLGIFGQVTLERLLQSTGKTVFSMISQATGAIINIILDPILIFGYFGIQPMGIRGAAVATVIGQTIAMFIALFLNIRFNKEIKLSFKGMKPDATVIKRIYAVGLPSVIMISVSSVMTYCMNIILGGFSTTATAVFGVYFKLQSFFVMPVIGLNNGMVPIISYNYGARRRSRITKTIKLCMIYAVGYLLLCFAACQLLPEQLFSVFEASPEMTQMGVAALRIITTHFLLAGICIVLSSVFQALGNGIYSLIVSLMRQLVALVPAAFLLSLTGDVNNVWWAFPIAELMSFSCCTFFMRRIYKKIIKPLPSDRDNAAAPQASTDTEPNEVGFKGAIFDLDGTLLNSMFLWKQIDHDFLLSRGIDVPDDYLQAIAHMGAVRTADYTIERFGLDEKPEEMIAEWTKMATDFYSNKVELKKGAAEYLLYLKSQGVKLAVATANDECLYMPALVHTDILKYFDAVVSVNDVSRGKGFPDVYELAAKKIGLPANECMVFEDVLIAVNGALDGGFRVTGIYDATSDSDKEEITRLSERFVYSFDELMEREAVMS